LCNGLAHEIAEYLRQRGVLIPGDDGKLSKLEQVIGKLDRFYVLSLTPLHANTEE
jgi:hypothetical protein